MTRNNDFRRTLKNMLSHLQRSGPRSINFTLPSSESQDAKATPVLYQATLKAIVARSEKNKMTRNDRIRERHLWRRFVERPQLGSKIRLYNIVRLMNSWVLPGLAHGRSNHECTNPGRQTKYQSSITTSPDSREPTIILYFGLPTGD